MIHVILQGSLGNWLFQYAVGRRLAQERGTGLHLSLANLAPPWRRSAIPGTLAQLRRFALAAEIHDRVPPAIALEIYAGFGARWASGPFWRERAWGWDPGVLAIEDGGWLFGYFQSERYFLPIAEALRAELAIEAPSPEDVPARELEARIAARESVAVHVRRGDYLRSPNHQVCTGAYYERAMRQLRDRTRDPWFFVFSDDPGWCREHLPLERGEVVDLPGSRAEPSDDLRLMSRCRHHIVSNSTFSWWAAWLGATPGQIVVVPARWFNDEEMNARAMEYTVPAAWTRIAP